MTEPKLLCGVGSGRGRLPHGRTLDRVPIGPEVDEVAIAALCPDHGLVMIPTAEYRDAVARDRYAVHLTRQKGAHTRRVKTGEIRGWVWIEHALLARRSGKA